MIRTIKRKKLLLFLAILTMSTTFSVAQTYTVSGIISDSNTGETVIGATVLVKGTYQGVVTNLNGLFRMHGLKPGNYIIEISHIGYETIEVSVKIEDRNLFLPETKLMPKPLEINEVTVVEMRPEKLGDREVETSIRELSIKAVKLIPTARNDVFRAIKFLPGIEGSSPFSPLVSIRGGDPGENMIMIDGVVLYNPYHVSVSAGVFNTNMVKDIELLVGGFGAEYGGRNSAIINVTTKDGNNTGFHGEFHPTSNHFKGFCEFPVSDNATMTLSGRAFYPLVSNFLMYSGTYFYDMNVSYTIKLGNMNRLSFKYFTSRDISSIRFSRFFQYLANSINDDVFSEAFDNIESYSNNTWNNNAGTFILRTILSPTLTLRSQVYGSFHQSDNSTALSYRFEDTETGELYFNDDYTTNFKSYIHDLCGKVSLTWTPGKVQTIKTGFEANSYRFYNSARLNGFLRGKDEISPWLIAGFLEDKIKAGPIIMRPGLRVTQYSEFDDIGLEPRVNTIIKLPADFDFKMAWGIYYQYITSMNTAEYEFSQMLDYYVALQERKPLKSEHYIVGFNKTLGESLTLSVDLFYKDMSRLYTIDLTQQASDDVNLGKKLIEGEGTAYGVETMLMGKWKSFSGWVSYTYGRSERKYPGYQGNESFLSEYDRTHVFKGVVNYQVTNILSYSMAVQCMSGHPTTVNRTRQNYYYFDPVSNTLVPSPQYVDNAKNNARLPFVIQLDMGLKKRIRSGFGYKLQEFLHADESFLTADIYNLTFFYRNIDYYTVPGFDNRYLPSGYNYIPSVGIGYSIKF